MTKLSDQIIMEIGLISPQDWGLPVADAHSDELIAGLEASPAELERRMRANIYEWLPGQFDEETGAYYGYYRAPDGYAEPPQTVNLIVSWQLMAAYDRFGDAMLLDRARSALSFFYHEFVISHPMSVVVGGVRDGVATHEVWTKFSAEFVIGALGLWRRAHDEKWLRRAEQSGRYLIQAGRHSFAPRYRLDTGRWSGRDFGWHSWGRVVEACLDLHQATGDDCWRELAMTWGEHALTIQAEDGCFYLIDEEYYNTDIAADELRGLIFLYELTGRADFLQAACAFADWHLAHQRPAAALRQAQAAALRQAQAAALRQAQAAVWPLTIDRDGNVVTPTVGPGDIPNIGIALLRLHNATGDVRYFDAALRCFRYSLSIQATTDSDSPYLDDPHVRWGFWSWDPYYDYTLSGDQSTHHVRGMMFLLDYLAVMKKLPSE